MKNDIISKRKSIRKYEQTVLEEAAMTTVRDQMVCVAPLHADIRYSIEIAAKTRGLFGLVAPHYLIFRSEEKAGAFENIGFVGQQMSLFFSENGIGSCWLGTAKPDDASDGELPFVISMAFGRPLEPLYRDLPGFKRKSLSEMSEGSDERLEAARLAPSGMNAQGWFFAAADEKIHCYRKKSVFTSERLSRIDMGIALCHIAQESCGFHFVTETGVMLRKGFVYSGTVL